MVCLSCNADNPAESLFCIKCGTPMPAAALSQEPQAFDPVAALWAEPRYASFWIRLAAAAIDGFLVTIAYYLVIIPLYVAIGVSGAFSLDSSDESTGALLAAAGALSLILSFGIGWLYEAILTSSVRQATFGKSALGLVVTDIHGERISFARASGRYFSKIPSSMIFMIGYFMQPFTEKKQALHDIMAGTVVLKK